MNPILFTVALVLFAYFLYKNIYYRPKNLPPGPSIWFPLFGHYLSILLFDYNITSLALHKMSKYYKSKILGLYVGPFPSIIACDEKSVKEMLMRPEFQGRPDQVLSLLRVDFGPERGIIFTEGDLWQKQKRFMLQNLRDFGFGKRSLTLEQSLQEEVMELVNFLKNKKQTCQFFNNENILIPNLFAWPNLNLLLKALTAQSLTRNELENIYRQALKFQIETEPLAGALTLLPFLKYFVPPYLKSFKKARDSNTVLSDFAKDAIKRRCRSYDINNNIECAVDAFINEMKSDQAFNNVDTYFTEFQLKLVIQDFMFPASTTIEGQLGFLWEQFLLHPEIQNKIQDEIDRVIGRHEIPTLDHRKDMPYTEAAIREIMRYKTLVQLAIPHRATEDAEFMGYFVTKGTLMFPNLTSMHLDKDLWGDPENFRPERFLDKYGKLKKKDHSLPFGLGKRLCPGETFSRQNMFMIVAALLQNFTFSLPEGAKLPKDDVYYGGLNNHPIPFWVKVTPRD